MTEQSRVPAGLGASSGQFTRSGHPDTGLVLPSVPDLVEVSDASGDVCVLTPGVIDQEARWVYTHGQCLALAVALSRRTGWPIAATTFEELDPDDDEPDGYRHHTVLRHAAVRTPAGDLLDINGDNDAESVECYPEDTVALHRSPDEVDRLLADQAGYLEHQDLAVADMFVDAVLAEVTAAGTDRPRCEMCGQFRARAAAHRCPAPGLVPCSPATSRVLDACRAAGGRPLIVGGSVRDALIARQRGAAVTPKDVDLEVYGAEPAALARELSAVGRVDDVGVSFGVLKVVCGGEDFDVSLPRTDSKVGSGHRGFEVSVDHDLDEVAAFGRRDFTVNALGWDPATAELVDPYGGAADLEQGVLRHTTDAFDEDPLRVLRGVQLAGRFDLAFAPETAHRCRGLVGSFPELPPDRVWGEWAKVARKADHPSASLRALHESGWEQHFVELADVRDVPQDPRWHPEGPVHVHTALSADAAARAATDAGLGADEREVVVLAAMLHDLGKATHTRTEADGSITSHGHAAAGVDRAERLLARMGAPHRVRELVGPLVAEHMTCAGTPAPTPAAVRRLTRRLAGSKGTGPTLTQWAAVVAADNAGRGTGSRPSPADAWVAMAGSLGEGPRPRTGLLTGAHLIAAGMTPGPRFRPLLAAALAAQDDGAFTDERGAREWLAAQR